MSNVASSIHSYYDAIVIGAGHNGLTCGCYLAKFGLKVLVINYLPNLKKETIKRVVFSPLDFENPPTNTRFGTLSCGAMTPYQLSSMRPIPELSNYKVPSIQNVYLCGSGSHPGTWCINGTW